jgi:hypothetical protein
MATLVLMTTPGIAATPQLALYPKDSDTLAETVTLTQATNRETVYTGTATVTGKHTAHLLDNGTALPWSGYVDIVSASGTYEVSQLSWADVERIWAHTPRTLSHVASDLSDVSSAGNISRGIASDWSITISGLGSLAGRTGEKVWFTIKRRLDLKSTDDSDSIIQVGETTGLLRKNGSTNVTAADAALTVDDEDDGDITITVAASVTDDLTNGTHVYDVKWKDATGKVWRLTDPGKFTIADSVTKVIT